MKEEPIWAQEPTGEDISEADLVTIARRISQWRRKRDAILAPLVFADPEWDILLDLYVEHGRGRPVTMSSLCIAAAVPTSTAARCIHAMVERGALIKSRDADDTRRLVIAHAEETHQKMRTWLLQVARGRMAAG